MCACLCVVCAGYAEVLKFVKPAPIDEMVDKKKKKQSGKN